MKILFEPSELGKVIEVLDTLKPNNIYPNKYEVLQNELQLELVISENEDIIKNSKQIVEQLEQYREAYEGISHKFSKLKIWR